MPPPKSKKLHSASFAQKDTASEKSDLNSKTTNPNTPRMTKSPMIKKDIVKYQPKSG